MNEREGLGGRKIRLNHRDSGLGLQVPFVDSVEI